MASPGSKRIGTAPACPRERAATGFRSSPRIALNAQVADILQASGGADAAIVQAARCSSTCFDSELAEAFSSVAERPAFLAVLQSEEIEAIVLNSEPCQQAIMADDNYLDDIAAAFSKAIDAKSPFNSGHSQLGP